METQAQEARPGDLSWRLSSHPITLLFFLGFRIASLLIYLFGVFFIKNFVLIFILTMLLLAADFYYLKNIAGRRLVGLRWWNEVNTVTGDSHWVFESQDRSGRGTGNTLGDGGLGEGVVQNATDKRFFWLALYVQPALWVGLGILAIIKLESPIWLSLIVIALVLTITNTLAFSRCDKFSQASNLATSAMYGSGIARSLAGGMFSRLWSR